MTSHLDHANTNDMRQIDIVKMYANKKCLVIDDFPEIRGALSRTLKNFGCQSVDTAANGEDAIRQCSAKNYDIVICDYNLGAGKDGQQILEEVRHLGALLLTSLFVMVTGESSREMVLGAIECQPDDYITKPYTQASIKLRLDKAVMRHEALLPIKKHITQGAPRKALDTCNAIIEQGGRYARDCLRLKGQLHLILKQFKQAKKVYQGVLRNKPLVWAKLGMSKALKELGDFENAKKMCQEIIDEDERYIEAHDLIADIYIAENESLAAQKSVERASCISPKSVLRHRKLAAIAEQNRDNQIALRSHQQAIKWGANSCHESEQDYFNYVRKVADLTRGDDSKDAKILLKQANNVLNRAKKRYPNRAEIAVQAQMLDTQIHIAQGSEALALESLQSARKLYGTMPSPPVDTSLEFARALHALQQEDEARSLLTKLAAKNASNHALLKIIDGITEEPISDAGKKVAAQLTKSGIQSYDQKAFTQAIAVFNEALASYPKHVGLHLNLVQAICANTEETGYSEINADMCQQSMHAVRTLPPEHKQYQRYQFLLKQVKKLYPNILQ